MKKFCMIFLGSLLIFVMGNKVQAETILHINFYDEKGSLLSSQELAYGTEIQVPTVLKDGYNFIGFNTQPDGSGEYLKSNIATTSNNYYAIYHVITYQVDYYVDNTLIHSETVAYGSNAPNIEVPIREGYLFEGWKGLEDIREDCIIYGTYTKVEVVKTVKYAELEWVAESEKDQGIRKESTRTMEGKIEKQKVLQEKKQNNRYLEGALIFVGSAIIFYLLVRKVKFKQR